MEQFKFRVQFLEEAKIYLDGLEEKTRDKILSISGNQDPSMIRSYLKNFIMKFGNLEQNIINFILDFLRFGIKQRILIHWLSQHMV